MLILLSLLYKLSADFSHNRAYALGVYLFHSAVVGEKSVCLVLNVRHLCVNEDRRARRGKRRDLVFVESDKRVLKRLARLKALISVVLLAEEMPLASVGISAEFAYRKRS